MAATAVASSASTSVAIQLSTPQPATAQVGDARTLRQIRQELVKLNRSVGTSGFGSSLWGEVRSLRRDQETLCRALAQDSISCIAVGP
jgi:hypothetical protein